MRFATTSIAVCVVLGSVAMAPQAEAAPGRGRHEASQARHAAPSRAVQQPYFFARQQGGRGASRSRLGGAGTATQDPQASLAFSTSIAPLSVSAAFAAPLTSRNGSPFAYNAYATSSWAGESTFGGRPSGGLQCVPYARQVSGVDIRGNARVWWHAAAGRYDRGNRPEPASVMAFRASGGMRNGHVAVVSRILGPRHVQIDHANWEGPGLRKGSIAHNVNVIDVSPYNDWTAVRVQIGFDEGRYGRVYPTHGFIYNRADTGTLYANTPVRLPRPMVEVAEAPDDRATPLNLDFLRRR